MSKRFEIRLFVALTFALLFIGGCRGRLPGQPNESERWRPRSEISDVTQLYRQNCAGCHGADGRRGAARSLNDPLYLAFVPDDEMRKVIAEGRAGTNMPAFSQQAGGSLTDQQISLLVSGMRSRWSRPDEFKDLDFPRYSVNRQPTSTMQVTPNSASNVPVKASPLADGDPSRGAVVYVTYCSRCHGGNGTGGSAGSIVDPNFLTMVSEQGLRTTVVVGRADLGKPDWRSNLPGHPMSGEEIDDVVAWLVAQRQPNKTTAAVATLK